ncbi:NUDIX domain-containing protein [Geofilum rubicundum]|uniref:MutT/Nudix family protein n=1 Tax=Geofilum rubicundum JCM 15548 TaxID=1236989 RepID=A0A0E9M1W8_9BACT|nr:NUDIX domain-containing protein [Geofilum rubicundum]GAO31583.1 MutT/Nudix family protein [Geofilum rubicundum JCM 15548]
MDTTAPERVVKFCPKCGSSDFPAQAERSFKCGDCGFHFFINAAAAVAALIVNEKGELLLTRRALDPKKGLLDLPGGFVDPGERAEEALVREIREELNLEVLEYQFLTSFPNAYVFSEFTVYTVDLAFVCQIKDFSGITWQDDISGYVFVRPEALNYSDICSDSIRRIIQLFVKNSLPDS